MLVDEKVALMAVEWGSTLDSMSVEKMADWMGIQLVEQMDESSVCGLDCLMAEQKASRMADTSVRQWAS